jgi:hypothetical protein
MRAIVLFLALTAGAFAQSPVIFGLRGGVPFTSNSSSILGNLGNFSSSSRFEVGPTLGVRLPLGFSVEGDALFKRETLNLGQFGGFTAGSTHSDSWQFPVMLKYTLGRQAIAPVLGAGVSVRHLNNFSDVPSYLFNGGTSANSVGFVAGGGVRLKLGPMNVTPEVRYTRWGGNSFQQALSNFLPLSQNEASFLVGITF